MPDISVIIPIYNVRNFIGRCAESLMKQTLDDVEFIFVDDCTPDDSIDVLMSVLEKYPDRKDSVRIVRHEVNKGLPSARNTGLELATGEYIFHCDGDDFLENDALEIMYCTAIEKDSDIVICNFFDTYRQQEILKAESPSEDTTGAIKKMLTGKANYNVWNKLVRSCIFKNNGIKFPDGHTMGEDLTMLMVTAKARRIVYIDKTLYHYVRWNSSAVTKTFTERKRMDLDFNITRIVDFLESEFQHQLDEEIGNFKLLQKMPLLLTSGKNGEYEIWRKWMPEANRFIYTSSLFNTRLKWMHIWALRSHDALVRLHYWIVIRFYYSIRYKSYE